MLSFVRYIDFVNGRRMIFKMYHIFKRKSRIFEMREKTELAGPKKITIIEISLQRIFIVKIVKSFF